MGFFDKIKASVGIGGARIELLLPPVATSGAKLPVRAIVRGGKLAQKLHGVDVSLEIWAENDPNRPSDKPAPGPAVTSLGRMPGSEGLDIAPDAELRFEMGVELPPCQTLYLTCPERYASLVVESGEEEDPTLWNVEGPLPMTSEWESSTVFLLASADIPGAIDPSAKAQIHVIPEAAGALAPAGALDEAGLARALEAAGAHRVFVSNAGDNWFVWWSGGGGRVVAYSPIKVVCSVRPEGVVRAHTNARIPEPSRLAKLPTETADQIDGGMDEAHALATRLVAEARAGVLLPRPVGNAWCALTSLMIVR